VTDEQPEINHIAVRPSWDCLVCELPWPCANAKEELLAEYRGLFTTLAIYMSVRMQDALEDLTANGSHPPPDLYERFLSWVQRAFDKERTDPQASPATEPRTGPHAPKAPEAFAPDPDEPPAASS
jgi:hypothetical protein